MDFSDKAKSPQNKDDLKVMRAGIEYFEDVLKKMQKGRGFISFDELYFGLETAKEAMDFGVKIVEEKLTPKEIKEQVEVKAGEMAV